MSVSDYGPAKLRMPALVFALLWASAPLPGADVPPGGLTVMPGETGMTSLLPYIMVRTTSAVADPSRLFRPDPAPDLYTHLPIQEAGGLGSALRANPYRGESRWVAVRVHNPGQESSWVLVARGTGFRPYEIVLTTGNDAPVSFSGAALVRMRHEAGVADMVAYRVILPPGRTTTVYMHLPAGMPFGSPLDVSTSGQYLAFVGAINRRAGMLLGVVVMAGTGFFLISLARHLRHRQPGLPFGFLEVTGVIAFPLLSVLSTVAGYRGNSLSALLDGYSFVRFGLSIGLGALAVIVEYLAGARRLPLMILCGAAVVMSATLPVLHPWTSFILPVTIAAELLAYIIVGGIAVAGRMAGDSSELRLLDATLEAETRGGSDFVAGMMLQMKEPLTGILALLDNVEHALGRAGTVGHRIMSDLVLARTEAQRLESLLADVLGHADGQAGMLVVDRFDLGAALRATAAVVGAHPPAVRIIVESASVDMHSDLGLVRRLLFVAAGRAVRTVRALNNSAGTDSPPDPSRLPPVRVSCSCDGRQALIIMEDSGNPAPVDMDLFVVSRLATLLGGSSSWERVGGSNRLQLILPLELAGYVAPAPVPALPEHGVEQRVMPPLRGNATVPILALGSSPVSVLSVKRMLEAAGWMVDATVSAVEALDRLTTGSYCLAIIDVEMGETDGYAFCEALRADPALRDIPVILILPTGRPDEIQRVFSAGADDYVVEPASGVELAARVRTHVELADSTRRELEQMARMAEFDKYRTLAMLSAGVAHEINTPNNAVLRNVPMLREIWTALSQVIDRMHEEEGNFNLKGFGYEDLKREVPEMLNDLYVGAQDIRRIVESLKDYTRTPSSSQPATYVDINESVRYAHRLLRHAVAVATGNFTLNLRDNLPAVNADRLKLTQVVVNILENALQSLPDRACGVTVETGTETGRDGRAWVLVRVTDGGSGMDEQTLARVFEPFFTTKRDRGGSGLGLAVASGIVRDFGGTIQLTSIPGNGTTATVRLPAAPPADVAAALQGAPGQTDPASDGDGKNE